MPKRVPPLSKHELLARIAGPRGAAVLRSVLLELLASVKEPSSLEETRATTGDVQVWFGRRPAGWVEGHPSRRGGPLGRYFALSARLKAGAIEAFRVLREELSAYYAPKGLLHEIDRAVADEAKQARVLTSLARRFGGVVREPHFQLQARRSLLELSLDNAIEGCVRETFGALIALYQTRATSDGSVAIIMQHLANDEVRHASLAFWVDGWTAARLDADEREAVAQAKRAALMQLREEASHEPARELVTLAGLPRSVRAVALLRGLRERLFES